ncbi:MAG: DUF4389 domain-containing protein [Actinomycetia bacterium]|nr:DUF4389 domain-containing protein [Actinomycetes bacterium]
MIDNRPPMINAAEIIEFLTYNTERKLWPFSPGNEAEPQY